MIDREFFFTRVRVCLFDHHLSQEQVVGMNKILDEWEARDLTDLRWCAYMLATVFHETGGKMIPVKEAGSNGYLMGKPYWPWIGMGLVQVTWHSNAVKFGAEKPEDLLSWPVALRALFDGMIKGMFTGNKLSDYFHRAKDDPLHARRIINGMDRAHRLAGYHDMFRASIFQPALEVA